MSQDNIKIKTLQEARDRSIQEYDMGVYENTKKLLAAQLRSALGNVHILKQTLSSNGKLIHRRVTDDDELELALDAIVNNEQTDEVDEDGNATKRVYYYISTKDPNVTAIKDLLDRTRGKAAERVEMNLTGKFSLLDLADEVRKLSPADYEVLEGSTMPVGTRKVVQRQTMEEAQRESLYRRSGESQVVLEGDEEDDLMGL
jgi:ribosomal protein S18